MRKIFRIALFCIPGILLIFCIFLSINLISYNNKLNELKKSENSVEINLQNIHENWSTYCDTNYKLFFGEWKVGKIIGENQEQGADENADALIGMTYFYSDGGIREGKMSSIGDGDYVVARQEYHYYLVPKDSDNLFPNMPSPDELGIEGEYVIFVSVIFSDNSVYSSDAMSTFKGGNFYVKDNDTLILYANNVFYEMNRISYYGDPDFRYY